MAINDSATLNGMNACGVCHVLFNNFANPGGGPRVTKTQWFSNSLRDGGGGLSSLNVSNAAAVALYAVSRNNAAQ